MFQIEIKVNDQDIKDIEQMPIRLKKGLLKGLRKGMFAAERRAKERMGRAGELQIGTGNLRRSIESGTDEYGGKAIGWLGSNVVYARIHELGGLIRPKSGKYLRFPIEGQWVTVRQVRIPPRPYLEPSIDESLDDIGNSIANSIIEEVENE